MFYLADSLVYNVFLSPIWHKRRWFCRQVKIFIKKSYMHANTSLDIRVSHEKINNNFTDELKWWQTIECRAMLMVKKNW